jgi:hypothetical protein
VKIAYLPRQRATKAPTQKLLDQADAIMQEYRSQGLDVTLRQLFYQFVSRGLLPNTQKAYKTLGDNVSEGRMHGDLDWDVLVDRGCELVSWAVESSPGDAIEELAASYRVDRWADQPYRVEVWIEKTALVGIVEKACSHQQVPYVALGGSASTTMVWEAAAMTNSQVGRPVAHLNGGCQISTRLETMRFDMMGDVKTKPLPVAPQPPREPGVLGLALLELPLDVWAPFRS